MTSRQRMLTALSKDIPDRLPVTTHHLMPYFLAKYMEGIDYPEFFSRFGMDAITWIVATRPDTSAGEFYDPSQGTPAFLEANRISSPEWLIRKEDVPDESYQTTRYWITTPAGELTTVLQDNGYTSWVSERLIKNKSDIDIIGKYVTSPTSDHGPIQLAASDIGERGIVRGHVTCFDIYGQPGTWQDAACLYGIENLIMATFDDPEWVHELLGILCRRKSHYVSSLKGSAYDLIELGGGDASSTVISPRIFDRFVAPYDSQLVEKAHEAGQRIVYHTCGGMMPLLERIADMGVDAMETFTPPAMGGDVDLTEAKKRIGQRVCMIGGLDQFHFFNGCSEEETRREVRRCFEAAGTEGSYVLSPSDHFFDAEPGLIQAFADEAVHCVYKGSAVPEEV